MQEPHEHQALAWLSQKPVQEFPRQRVVYDFRTHPANLYILVSGRVKVTQTAQDGSQAGVRIVAPGGLFGEFALVGANRHSEIAIALDPVKVIAWTISEIELQIEREPAMGLALIQQLVRQCRELEERIACMALCKTPERIALALVQLAATLGSGTGNGMTRMAALTHQTLADYVGTSREIVTFQLNRLKRLGLVRYSRKYLDVHSEGLLDAAGKSAPVLSRKPRKAGQASA